MSLGPKQPKNPHFAVLPDPDNWGELDVIPSVIPMDAIWPPFKDVITEEIYTSIVMLVVHHLTEDILKHQTCVVCREPLFERSEGMTLDPNKCWYTRYNNTKKNEAGHYYCKNSPGTLLAPDTKMTKAGIQDVGQIAPHNTTPKELSELPFNIIGNEKGILKATTDTNYGLTIYIDIPGYSKSEVTVVLSKTSFNDYALNIFMDNKLKGPKEVSFNIAAELYDPNDYKCTATAEDGLLILHFPRRESFGTKTIHIKGSSAPNTGFPIK